MKQQGFTLAEVLITMAIIGVVAMIALPVATKMKPDSNKVMYLKTYNALAETIKSFASSSSAFPSCQGDICFYNKPLYNTSAGVNNAYEQGNSKVCKMLAEQFNAATNTCSNNYEQFDGNHFMFSAQNGVQFFVSTLRTEPGLEDFTATYQTDIWFDINGDKAPNKYYGEDGCTKPDRYKVLLASDGKLVPADPMGKMYLKSNKNWIVTPEVEGNGAILANLDAEMRSFGVRRVACPNGYELAGGVCIVADVGQGDNQGNLDEGEQGGGGLPDMTFLEYDCSKAYINSNPGYGVNNCKTAFMESTDRRGNYKEAYETCSGLGLRLPTYHEMSAAGNYFDMLGLTSGNYWTSYESKDPNASTQHNCNMPTGNCGSKNASVVQNYRCMYGDWHY